MSMYANTSEQYWKQRKKPTKKKPILFAGIFFLIFATCMLRFQYNKSKSKAPAISLPRPNVTQTHFKKCLVTVKSNNNDCAVMCNSERENNPRPTMYQACLHGCSSAFFSAIDIGCRDNSLEDMLREVASLSYDDCSKYQNMLPKPELYSTCRKYHKIASDKGFEIGSIFINNELDYEWDLQKKKKLKGQTGEV